MMNKAEIASLFETWNSAIQTGDPKKVTDLYRSDAILLPTISNKVRHNHQEIEDYFVQFQENNPKGEINESNIRNLGTTTIHSGIYTFTFKDDSKVKARFTFVYQWNGQDWKIIEHHSSQMPE
jgi:uncharacterized protein (TIGR02246 family)